MIQSYFPYMRIASVSVTVKSAFFLIFAQIWLCSSISATESPTTSDITIATYQYPGIDRKSAIMPLSLILKGFDYKVNIRLAQSPSELASLFANDEIDISVPNLSGYVDSEILSQNVFLIAVPDNAASEYTSSIISSVTSQPITEILKQNHTVKEIAMVWPDSVSGAIIASIYLEALAKSGEIYKLPNAIYVNSHANVLKEITSKKQSLGVVATQAYLKYKKSHPNLKILENWRSTPIPFGPIICNTKIVKICQLLQNELLNNPTQQTKVLKALKRGWPEFETSQKLVKPDRELYQAIAKSLKSKTAFGQGME